MFALLGEDNSDVETLDVLIRRIADVPNMSVRKKGYTGCAEMLIKGAAQVRAYSKLGCTHFVICYDADKDDPAKRRQKIITDIIEKSRVDAKFCALVPVQEMEAWVLADLEAVTNIIPSWKPKEKIHHPESQADPKEYLEKLSRATNHKPLYVHAIHNPRIAKYLNLAKVVNKCPSALPLFEIVKMGKGNYPLPSEEVENQIRKKILLEYPLEERRK